MKGIIKKMPKSAVRVVCPKCKVSDYSGNQAFNMFGNTKNTVLYFQCMGCKAIIKMRTRKSYLTAKR